MREQSGGCAGIRGVSLRSTPRYMLEWLRHSSDPMQTCFHLIVVSPHNLHGDGAVVGAGFGAEGAFLDGEAALCEDVVDGDHHG